MRRRIVFVCENLKNRCIVGGEDLAQITAAGQVAFRGRRFGPRAAVPHGRGYPEPGEVWLS